MFKGTTDGTGVEDSNQNRKGTPGTCLKGKGCTGKEGLWYLHVITIRGGWVALNVIGPMSNKWV